MLSRSCLHSFFAILLSFSLLSLTEAATPPRVVFDFRELITTLGQSETDRLPGGFALAIPEGESRESDPRFDRRYNRIAYVYGPHRDVKGILLGMNVRVHYDKEDETMALRTARLVARFLRLHKEKFGHEAVFPRGTEVADIWLSQVGGRDETTGGETWNSHIYVYSVQEDRTPTEWVRTLAHEWGHLTLPAARGFFAPENDASGYLGERLFFKWMNMEGTRNAVADGTTPALIKEYCDKQVTPLIDRFQESGPSSALLGKMTADGMDYYIGMALAFDDAYGPRLTGQALFSIDGESPEYLLKSMKEAISLGDRLIVRLPAWTPLSKTNYAVIGNATGSVQVSNRPPFSVRKSTPFSLNVKQPGWKSLRVADGEVTTIILSRNGGSIR
jgi:hypothetical protein